MRLGGREQNGGGNRAAAKTMILGFARSAAPVHRLDMTVMGIGLWGLSPLCEIGISRRSVYQMTRIG